MWLEKRTPWEYLPMACSTETVNQHAHFRAPKSFFYIHSKKSYSNVQVPNAVSSSTHHPSLPRIQGHVQQQHCSYSIFKHTAPNTAVTTQEGASKSKTKWPGQLSWLTIHPSQPHRRRFYLHLKRKEGRWKKTASMNKTKAVPEVEANPTKVLISTALDKATTRLQQHERLSSPIRWRTNFRLCCL